MPKPRKWAPVKRKSTFHTQNPGHEHEIDWTIDNVLKFVKESFFSKIDLRPGCRTRLNAVVRVIDRQNFSDFKVGFRRDDKSKISIRVCYELSIMNVDGDVYKQKQSNMIIQTADQSSHWILSIRFIKPENVEASYRVTREDLEAEDSLQDMVSKNLVVWDEGGVEKLFYLLGDSVVIKGAVKVFGCCVSSRTFPVTKGESGVSDKAVTRTQLVKDLECGFESGEFTDVSVKVDGEEVRAHRFILAARSPALKLIIEQISNEGKDEFVINDMKKPVFEFFLRYLYVGYVGAVKWGTIVELYSAGSRYEVDSLRKHCRQNLVSNLNESRVYEALELAHKYCDDNLRDSIVTYVSSNYSRVRKTDNWKSFIRDNPVLALDITRRILAELTVP